MKSFHIGVLATLCTSVFLLAPVTTEALTISPVKLELEADPGETIGGEIELYNEETVPRELFVSFENFEPSGDLGNPRFIGGADGLATWITATEALTLAPDERKSIPYTITIPQDAKPGGYFAAIFYGAQNPRAQEGGEVAVGGKIGVLVLLRVNGDITEEGGINSFTTKDSQRFFTMLPIEFITQMTNRGGDRITPRGGITISNLLGMEVTRIEVNTNEGSILPNSRRTFTSEWKPSSDEEVSGFFGNVRAQLRDLHFGVYRAKIELVWGAEQNVSINYFWFLILPWQLLIVVAGLGILLVFGFKKYNSFIIERARR